jgi:hypothetical protein
MERSGNMDRQDQDWGPQTANMNTEGRRGRQGGNVAFRKAVFCGLSILFGPED